MVKVGTSIGHLCLLLPLVFASVSGKRQKPPEFRHGVRLPTERPLVLAHRGSAGTLPEHTVAGYERAVKDGADVIECDVCVTKDLRLVCLHESWLKHSSNVKDLPEFAGRRTSYTVEGSLVEDDWFSVDFTLAELKTLKKRQTLPFRDSSFNDQFPIATLAECIEVAKKADRTIGIYPETKNPEWVNSLDIMRGTTVEELLVAELERAGYTRKDDPCFIQSFSEHSLRTLSKITDLPLVMLIWQDMPVEKLTDWSQFCYGMGLWKDQVIRIWDEENEYKNNIRDTTDLVEQVHHLGMKVHVYTLRNEDEYLAWDYNQDPTAEIRHLLKFDIDGYFTDFTSTLVSVLDQVYARCEDDDDDGGDDDDDDDDDDD